MLRKGLKSKLKTSNRSGKEAVSTSAAPLKTKNVLDLIKFDDTEEIGNLSEDSETEIEYQPSKVKRKDVEFNQDFEFVSSAAEYKKDVWNDLQKFMKKSNRTDVADTIAKVVSKRKVNLNDAFERNKLLETDENVGEGRDLEISDDELKHDEIREKNRKTKKSSEPSNFFEEVETEENDISSFYQMNLSRPLMKSIAALGYVHPTPIQASTIPIALQGRDICGAAVTGSGKTAAFLIPTIERLLYKPVTSNNITRVLVLVPTRELGAQVYQVSKQLCQFTTIDIGLAIGGLDVKVQEAVLRKNPDIVIATPGRLIDHIKNTPSFSLDSIEVLILDEADRMLDEYFAAQMKEIIQSCSTARQTMLFSATMTDEVKDLMAVSLNRPVKLFVNSTQGMAMSLRQEFIRIRENREDDREPLLAALVCRTFFDHVMVFVQTKKMAHRLRVMLGLLGIKSGELHGDLTQSQRLESLNEFKENKIDVLIATDVAARGLDISDVKTVINFVMPITLEHYIHRVGRTARAGRAGISISLVGESERKMVKEIAKNASNAVKNRIIAPDIIEKYKNKLRLLEPEIQKVFEEEKIERMLRQTENELNKTEKKLKAEKGDYVGRKWFQSHKERMEEKASLSLKSVEDTKNSVESPKTSKNQKRKYDDSSDLEDNYFSKARDSNRKGNRQNKSTKKLPESDPVQKELETASLTRAKLSKYKHKLRKIKAVLEDSASFEKTKAKVKNNKTRPSNFALDFTDTSRKTVKNLRYDANKMKRIQDKTTKISKVKLTNKAGLNKTNKGKNFGAPKQKKSKPSFKR